MADARTEALRWAPETRGAYVAGWNEFTRWCLDNGCAGLPPSTEAITGYLEHLIENEGRAVSTARARLAAIAAAHRLGGYPDSGKRQRVKATVKRRAREYGKPRRQARGLTAEALAAVKATSRIQRVHQGKLRRRETAAEALTRALVDLALLQVMRDALLRRSEAAALTWGNIEVHTDGSGRITVTWSKTGQGGQGGQGAVVPLGAAAVQALLAIRPTQAVIDASASVFNLSSSQIGRRIKRATEIAGLGDGYTGHIPRVGMAQNLSAAGAGLPALMTAGRRDSPQMPAKYTEAQAAKRGAVARYYREGSDG